jgi:hypothetical protein
LTVQVGDDANVISKIKAISKMNALVTILAVVLSQGLKNSKFYPTCITVLLNRANDLDSTLGVLITIISFDNLSKGSLTKKLDDFVYIMSAVGDVGVQDLTSLSQVGIGLDNVMAIVIITLVLWRLLLKALARPI